MLTSDIYLIGNLVLVIIPATLTNVCRMLQEFAIRSQCFGVTQLKQMATPMLPSNVFGMKYTSPGELSNRGRLTARGPSQPPSQSPGDTSSGLPRSSA